MAAAGERSLSRFVPRWAHGFTARVVAAGMVSLLLVTGLVVVQARDNATSQQRRQASAKASAAARALDQLFTEWRSELLLAANNRVLAEWYSQPSLRDQNRADVNALLVSLNRLYPDLIDEACFIDRGGREEARQVLGRAARVPELSPNESGNPFFAPTFALPVGAVLQHDPYISPDSGRWVIANSTPIEVGGKQVALLHFEASLQGVRTRLARIVGGSEVRVVDDHGRVVIDTGAPQPIGHAQFATIAATKAPHGVSAGVGVTRTANNKNHWTVEVTVPHASPFSRGDVMRLTFVLLLAVVGLFIAARRLSRQLTRPVASMTIAADRIAEGDLTQRVPTSDDEVGMMARALNHVADRLDGAIGEIAHETETLAAAAEELNAVSGTMAETAERSSNTASQMTQEALAVREALVHLGESATSMSTSMHAILEHSGDATAVAHGASAAAAEATDAVHRLGSSSEEIGAVVKLIESIADQTNLLALNATIEAARAGDAGKGFAVVATEVKDLAQHTGAATADISAKMDAIRADAAAVTASIEEIGHVIARVQAAQDAIAAAASEQSQATSAVAQNIDEARTVADAIERNVGLVVEAAHDAARGADQNRDTSAELASMAGRLSSLTGRFRHSRGRV
jgi:methyl-accepting chemotaxis protein